MRGISQDYFLQMNQKYEKTTEMYMDKDYRLNDSSTLRKMIWKISL